MDRIVFAKNPWPKGHAIKELRWSGRIEPEGAERGLWFDLHLQTEAYDAADRKKRGRGKDGDEEEELDDDWKSKVVWNNYGRCTLSSTQWDGDGFRVATEKKPLDFSKLAKTPFRVDFNRKNIGEDGPHAFGLYLLGHDSVANHVIHFARRRGPAAYSLVWEGRIALSYAGRTKLEHRFSVTAAEVRFDGFYAPKGTSTKGALELLEPFVTDVSKYTARRRAGRVLLTSSQ